MYGLSSFFIGEQKVTEELGPMMRAAPTQDMQVFLATQIADEARHVRFFDRFYAEVGVLDSDNLAARLKETEKHLNPAFNVLFDEMLGLTRAHARRGPHEHERAGRGDHALPHGDRGHAGAHRPALHHRLQRARGHAARVRAGLQLRRARRAPPRGLRRALPARRRSPRTRGYKETIQRTLTEALEIADEVLDAAVGEGPAEDYEFFGVSIDDTRDFAAQALTRRLKVIGLVPAG